MAISVNRINKIVIHIHVINYPKTKKSNLILTEYTLKLNFALLTL